MLLFAAPINLSTVSLVTGIHCVMKQCKSFNLFHKCDYLYMKKYWKIFINIITNESVENQLSRESDSKGKRNWVIYADVERTVST